jgi:hypothetical protein
LSKEVRVLPYPPQFHRRSDRVKTKSIKLSYPHGKAPHKYMVERVTDTVEYHPGQLLDEKKVETLCGADRWKVTVVPVKSDDEDVSKGDE